jgi:ribosomal protein S18 acetylase RimI-like enzyme
MAQKLEGFRARTYQPKDLEACVAIFDANASGFRLPLEKKDFVRFLTGLPHTGLALMLEDRSGATAACGGIQFRSADEAALCWGMVEPKWHGKGLGEALRLLRFSLLSEMPAVKRVSVTVSQNDASFFENLGFKVESIVPNGYSPGLHRHCLVLDLTEDFRSMVSRKCSGLGLSFQK